MIERGSTSLSRGCCRTADLGDRSLAGLMRGCVSKSHTVRQRLFLNCAIHSYLFPRRTVLAEPRAWSSHPRVIGF